MGSEFYYYKIEKVLGKGTFGNVYKVKHLRDNKRYAMKKIRVRNQGLYDIRNTVTELRILAFNRSPYLVNMTKTFMSNNDLCIVMEYANCGDLSNKIRRIKQKSLDFDISTIWSYFCQISLGINYLHEHFIIHRDLKSANILLFDKGKKLKLADFGISRITSQHKISSGTQIGTPLYMGPEMLNNQTYGTKVDMWSLGCILYEMIHLECPFNSYSLNALKRLVLKGKYIFSKRGEYVQFEPILKNLLEIDQEKRWSVDQIINYHSIDDKIEEFGLETKISRTVFKKIPTPRTNNRWYHTIKQLTPMLIERNKEKNLDKNLDKIFETNFDKILDKNLDKNPKIVISEINSKPLNKLEKIDNLKEKELNTIEDSTPALLLPKINVKRNQKNKKKSRLKNINSERNNICNYLENRKLKELKKFEARSYGRRKGYFNQNIYSKNSNNYYGFKNDNRKYNNHKNDNHKNNIHKNIKKPRNRRIERLKPINHPKPISFAKPSKPFENSYGLYRIRKYRRERDIPIKIGSRHIGRINPVKPVKPIKPNNHINPINHQRRRFVSIFPLS